MTNKPFCPECDSGHITVKKAELGGNTWYCKNCPAEFDEPNYREPKNDPRHHGRSGLAKALVDANPDDL